MKIEINGKLPKGFKLVNGKVVRAMSTGGTVNKTLAPIPRDQANLEAEKGETTLTDLTNDGSFELYNIGGKRHTQGGTPLNLPEQSFVYSDTRSMKLTIEELKSLGINSKKKMTPAEASKKFPLNEYIEILEDENSDKVSIDTAEEMINKNKIKLSQIAFLQESKKDFSDGLPLAAYPFLISKGINPQEMEAKIQEKNGPQQNPSPEMSQQQMAMGPQQGNLQQFTGPPQGGPPMPPQGPMPPMGKYGTELPKAMFGTAGLKYMNPFMKNKEEKLQEDVGDMMGMAKMFAGAKYGGEPCPVCGKTNCGCNYKTGGQLPKAQWGLPEKYNKAKNAILNWKPINYINPFAGKLTDNWLISKGGVSNDLLNTKLRLGDQSLGLINTDQGYFGDKSTIENVNIGADYQGYGLGTQLYNKGLQVGTGQIVMPGNHGFMVSADEAAAGLISGDQSINPMESPEKTVEIWKYFDKEIVQLKPWTTDKEKMWTDAGDHDFSQYLVTDEKTGAVTYTGPEVRLTGLNEAGRAKVARSEQFFRDLMIESQGTGPGGSSPILNWETDYVQGVGPDWHSPIGREIMNKFKTSFGREPRIGNGAPGDKTFKDYNKAGLYLLLGLGTFSYFNQDKIDSAEEKELYDKWLKKQAEELGILPEQYDDWVENPQNYTTTRDKDPDYIDDSTKQGIPIERLGGEPFKINSLRKFTNGGDWTPVNGDPTQQAYGAAPSGVVQGGVMPEVEVFGDMGNPTTIGPGEKMLMDMAENRRKLLQSYSGIQTHVQNNPNVLEDPEQGGVIQAQIMAIEEQIQAIDLKTSAIEKQLLNQKLQLDPFSDNGSAQVARYGGQVDLNKFVYGGALPKYQKKGQTYGDYMKEKGYPVPEDETKDYIYDPLANNGEGGFVGKKTTKGEPAQDSGSTYTYTDEQGGYASPNPYYHTRTDASAEYIPDPNNPGGMHIKNPNYDPTLGGKYNEGADMHHAFYDIMKGDDFKNVRANWMKKTRELINDQGYLKRLLKKYNGDKTHPSYISGKAAYDEMVANIGTDPTKGEQYLFKKFNEINKLFTMAGATGHKLVDKIEGESGSGSAAALQERLDLAADKMGLPRVSRADMMAYQTMYGALAFQKEQGTDDDKKLLSQINLNFSPDATGGHIQLEAGNISEFDGFAGDNTSVQRVGVTNQIDDIIVPEIVTVECTGEVKRIEMDKCVAEGKEFDPDRCKCKEIPPMIPPPEKPRYETFDQDDLAVSVKSGQFPTLLNPTRQATPDPAMVDPMYVDPRQQLSSLEATAAAAIRAGANPTSVMGSLQDESEKVINKHEALNTKIYNNAMNINVPALQQFTQSKMENEKNYMDETAMAMGNYQTEYRDAEDALLSAEQTQMSNADEMYIRNLENPNYWFSPKRHNIEFYNEKDIHGNITPGPMSYDDAYTDCASKFTSEREIRACIEMKTGAKRTNDGLNVNRNSENQNDDTDIVVSLGKEVKGFSKRQKDLVESRNKLRKWLTGH